MKRIKVFEYQALSYSNDSKKVPFTKQHFEALVKLNELHKNKYFTVGYKKIIFKNYVGVIQVDDLTIEILPKIDQGDHHDQDEKTWQNALIEMLRVTKKLKVENLDNANVDKQNIHLLDIYFEWFLNEVQLLMHQGLIKQYYKQTNNVKALKGKLEFAGHISKNLVHKERFYTTHQVYDKNHLVHQVLNQALTIIAQLSKGTHIYNRCKTIQLDFPEVTTINANQSTFSRIPKSRKTAPYTIALETARFIILNYAPNVSGGQEKMLALLFDMNNLWEQYILVKLKEAAYNRDMEIYGQDYKDFWDGITIRPDIVIENGLEERFIIDTKWKDIDSSQPSTHDLRQMYVYNDYWKAKKAILLYPSKKTVAPVFIKYSQTENHQPEDHCALGKLHLLENGVLKTNIGVEILSWFD